MNITKTIDDYPMQTVVLHRADTQGLEGDETRPIGYIFEGHWAMLDNFAPCPTYVDVGYGHRDYMTSEHAFAAAKARSKAQHDVIAGARSPGNAKSLGRSCDMRADWEDVKFEIMWQVLIAKFTQNPHAMALLLDTGQRLIYEGNYWSDKVWGVTRERAPDTWSGRNGLGAQLMELRDLYTAGRMPV